MRFNFVQYCPSRYALEPQSFIFIPCGIHPSPFLSLVSHPFSSIFFLVHTEWSILSTAIIEIKIKIFIQPFWTHTKRVLSDLGALGLQDQEIQLSFFKIYFKTWIRGMPNNPYSSNCQSKFFPVRNWNDTIITTV